MQTNKINMYLITYTVGGVEMYYFYWNKHYIVFHIPYSLPNSSNGPTKSSLRNIYKELNQTFIEHKKVGKEIILALGKHP